MDLIWPSIFTLETDARAVIDLLRNLEPITLGLLQIGSVFKVPTISTCG
jgi:hypothetical protein